MLGPVRLLVVLLLLLAGFPAGTLRDLPSPRDSRLEEAPRVPPPATVREV
jgi:hypothetical protein